MLTGEELLAKIKECGDAPKSDVVAACGYVSTRDGGKPRLRFASFYEAVSAARGVVVGGSGSGRRTTKKSRRIKCHGNGSLLVGKAYTQELDIQPGDVFEVRLGRGRITLVPVGESLEQELEEVAGAPAAEETAGSLVEEAAPNAVEEQPASSDNGLGMVAPTQPQELAEAGAGAALY